MWERRDGGRRDEGKGNEGKRDKGRGDKGRRCGGGGWGPDATHLTVVWRTGLGGERLNLTHTVLYSILIPYHTIPYGMKEMCFAWRA